MNGLVAQIQNLVSILTNITVLIGSEIVQYEISIIRAIDLKIGRSLVQNLMLNN